MDSITDLLAGFGWREWILIAVLAMTVYFVFMVLRYMQLPRAAQLLDPNAPEIRTPPPEFDAPPGTALAGVWPQPVEPRIGGYDTDEETVEVPRPVPAAPAEALDLELSTPAAPATFARHLEQASLGADMRQLQVELAQARGEITRLRTEISQLQAAQHVSPLYGEAMTLAVRGLEAASIAGRCGISIAEAELVVALSNAPGKAAHNSEDHHG